MGIVREVFVRENYIYALDGTQQVVFVFDRRGNFVSKLNKRGQGGDEYLWMGPVFIDDSEKYIEVVDMLGAKMSILKYTNLSFEMISKSHFVDLQSFNSCKRNNGCYYFSLQQISNIVNGKETNADLVVWDGSNAPKIWFDKKVEFQHMYYVPYVETFAKNDRGEIFGSFMYNNTFYRLECDTVKPVFTVDFGKYGIDNSYSLRSMDEQINYIKNTDGLASFPVLNLNNSDIMAFSYYFKQGNNAREHYKVCDFRQYIKLKNDKIYHVKYIKNDLTDFPQRLYLSTYLGGCAHEAWFGDYLVDVVIPSTYFSELEETEVYTESLGKITADDDPIVVLMKLKK